MQHKVKRADKSMISIKKGLLVVLWTGGLNLLLTCHLRFVFSNVYFFL